MTSSYGNSFSSCGQGLAGFEYIKNNNTFYKNDHADNQFYRNGNVLEPISVFASNNMGENRYKNTHCDVFPQIDSNESSKSNMGPSKSMPHFPNFGFCDARNEGPADNFDWPTVSFSATPNAGIKPLDNSQRYQFEHTLMAQTSSAVKINQESLTYLNQGQCYEIKLKCMKGYEQHQYFKSIIRVIFHERRLQYSEKALMEIWKNNRPGERIIDLDIPECCGLVNVEVDPDSLNSIGFVWSPSKPTGIFVKIHCISTEFTANKHGGEKGVPLRIKVETYSVSSSSSSGNKEEEEEEAENGRDEKLIHCSSCQIKVFKPKGADRKHKRDIEKLSKLNHVDRSQYRNPEGCTILKEMPLDGDTNHTMFTGISSYGKVSNHSHLIKTTLQASQSTSNISISRQGSVSSNDTDVFFGKINNNNNNSGNINSSGTNSRNNSNNNNNNNNNCGTDSSDIGTSFYMKDGNSESDGMDHDSSFILDCNNSSSSNNNNSNPVSGIAKQEIMSEEAARLLMSSIPVVNESSEVVHLSSRSNVKTMNLEQLARWLVAENFAHQSKNFETFTGVELLQLSQDDLSCICGAAEGIRLYNALNFGTTKPKLSIYVSFLGVSKMYTKFDNAYIQNHHQRYGDARSLMKSMTNSLSHNNLIPSLEERMEEENDHDYNNNNNNSNIHNKDCLPPFQCINRLPMLRSASLSSVRMTPYHNPRSNNNPHCFGPAQDHKRRHQANGRTRLNSEEQQPGASGYNANVVQRGTSFEESTKSVFYPIDLDVLSVKNLRDKLSVLFNVPVHQDQQIFFEQFGIQIIASDDHLQNIPNHSKFIFQIIKCQDSPNVCDILLKLLSNKPSYFQS